MSRLLTLAAAPVVAGAVLLMPVSSVAQSGHSIMITDDGAGPQVFHLTVPDLRQARRPDFVRDDLPLFNQKLDLDAVQRMSVRERLEAYLAEFDALAKATLPEASSSDKQIVVPGGPVVVRPGGHAGHAGEWHGDHGAGVSVDDIVHDAIGDVSTLDVDADVGPGGMAIAIRAGVGTPIGDAEGEDGAMIIVTADEEGEGEGHAMMPDSGVVVAIETGEDVPEEVREELQKKAEAMADRLREQIAQGEMPGMGGMHMRSPEDRMKRMEELAEKVKKFNVGKVGLKQQFVTDVRAMLQPDQLDRWPALDRALVRKKTLPAGELAGERTDLTEVLGGVYLSEAEQEEIAETLWGYEMALHDALTRRNAFLASAEGKIGNAMKNGEPDRAIAVAERSATLRTAVRDVNESYRDLLAAQLEADTAAAFRRRALEQSYPKIYRPRHADKVFAAAQRIDGLEDETRAGVDELYRAYRAELETMNEQVRRTVKQHEPARSRRALEHVKEAMAGGSMDLGIANDERIREAYQRRNALDDRYVKYLRDMLTPDQVALLPTKPKRSKGPIIIERSANEEY
ncbi:MAG: hypothetical protein KJO43_13815 [Phycisphaerae bacterium]|nr:hypothetical protein [Phycisphaerae bacterium]